MIRWCLILCAAILALSCGTRKTAYSSNTLRSDSLYVNSHTADFKTDTLSIIEETAYTVEPLDTSKPFIFNGRTYKNAKLTTSYKKVTAKGVKVDRSKSYTATESSKTLKNKIKNTENDNKITLWIGGFFILALFLYFILIKIFKL